jgi:hypothetical protein
VRQAVLDLSEDPDDADRIAALRLQVRKALAEDRQLGLDLAELLHAAGNAPVAAGERSIAADTISGVASTGDGSVIYLARSPETDADGRL